jgi:hypothetical protein
MDDLGWERIASGGRIENISLSDLAEPYASKGSGTDCMIGSSIGSDLMTRQLWQYNLQF